MCKFLRLSYSLLIEELILVFPIIWRPLAYSASSRLKFKLSEQGKRGRNYQLLIRKYAVSRRSQLWTRFEDWRPERRTSTKLISNKLNSNNQPEGRFSAHHGRRRQTKDFKFETSSPYRNDKAWRTKLKHMPSDFSLYTRVKLKLSARCSTGHEGFWWWYKLKFTIITSQRPCFHDVFRS